MLSSFVTLQNSFSSLFPLRNKLKNKNFSGIKSKIENRSSRFHSNILCHLKSSLCKILIQNGIKLIKKGKSYVAICPFHVEKTPSFSIDDEKNVYHCFGCGESGNLESFIRKIKKESYLKNSANFSIDLQRNNINFNEAGGNFRKYNEESYLFEHNTLILIQIACNYYQKLVAKNKVSKVYFFTRGISPLTAKFYRLGYSCITKESLFKLFFNFNVDLEYIIQSGLFCKKTGILYDMFQNRLIIPIFDQKGLIIGFGGRLIANLKFPKYLNSPDSPVFKKSRCTYSEFNFKIINKFKPKIGILVEGYMDSIVLVQNGIRFSLASLGTGISRYHLQRTFILTQNNHILLCLDCDSSGKEAAKKSFLILFEKNKNIKLRISISDIDKFKDPDEFTYFKGGFAFTNYIINNTKPGILWIENLCYNFNKDIAFFLNSIVYEIAIVLVKIFNNNIADSSMHVFARILLRENSRLTSKIDYFFYKSILQNIKLNKQSNKFNIKRDFNLFNKKKVIDYFGLQKITRDNFINEKKFFFASFILFRIGQDIFYNNFCCFLHFSDYSKYIFQKRRNVRLLNSNVLTFEHYWDEVFSYREIKEILNENTDEYFMKIFNINMNNLLKVKMTSKSFDNFFKANVIYLLITKKNSMLKDLGKFQFIEKKLTSIFILNKKPLNKCNKKRMAIFENKKKKKGKLINELNAHILYVVKFKTVLF